jgi:hypothetical protein
MPKMHPELQGFFDAHGAKTAGLKRAAHDSLSQLMQMCDEIDAHISDLQSKLTQAELAAHDHALDGKLEWMHTRLNAAKHMAAEYRRAARGLARVLVEVDESFSQDVIDVNTMLAVRGRDGTKATGPAASVPESENVVG